MTLRWDTRSRAGQSVKNWINPSVTVEYLIIAGGGGGGSNYQNNQEAGGGGGAGGYRSSVIGETTGGGGALEVLSALSISAGSYTVVVGAGGAGTVGAVTNGSDSSFAGLTSTGGGRGGSYGGVIVPYSGVVLMSNLATNLRSGIPQR